MKMLRKLIILVLVGVIIFSAVNIFQILNEYHEAETIYEESRNNVFKIKDDATIDLIPQMTTGADGEAIVNENYNPEDTLEYYPDVEIDFAQLKKVNSDVIGWIYVPNTEISYPLVMGDDNQYYVNYTYNHANLSSGSIFADYRNSSDLTDQNTIIYGHNMKNGSMFGNLKKMGGQEYYEKHKYVYIYTESGVNKYKIYSAYTTTTSSSAYTYSFSSESAFQNFLNYTVRYSAITAEITPTVEDTVITLSTCTSASNDGRFVVHAVLIYQSADEAAE